MNDSQNKFYTSISKYYSEIFPYSPMQLKFIKTIVGDLNHKSILDIGCATGELSSRIVNENNNVVGIDLNSDLIKQAKENKIHSNLKFAVGNMLNLKNDYSKQSFDSVMCFGNTIVHLQSEELILDVLKSINHILKSKGKFMLQILNYDYIIEQNITSLNVLNRDNVKFIRNYDYDKNSNLIDFKTKLLIKSENKIVSNSTKLLALGKESLNQLLVKSGFENIKFYSSFDGSDYNGNHMALILSCSKK